MSKKTTTKTPVVPAMFSKNPPSAPSTTTSSEGKTKTDRLVPWVEK